MTSTRSAADTGLPHRRKFLASLAPAGFSLVSGSAFAVSAKQTGDTQPSLLSDLIKALVAADARRKELAELCDKTYAEIIEPPIPESLFWSTRDWVVVNPSRLEKARCPRTGKPRYTYASEGVVEMLRDKLAEWRELSADTRHLCGIDQRIARAEEIISAIEAQEESRVKAEADCGFTAANEAYIVQRELVERLQQRIAATPGDVRAKARAALVATGCSLEWVEKRHAALLAKPKLQPGETEQLLAFAVMIDAAKAGFGAS